MDPTEIPQAVQVDGTQRAINSQGILLGQHDQLIWTLLENNQQLIIQVTKLTTQVANLSVPNPPRSLLPLSHHLFSQTWQPFPPTANLPSTHLSPSLGNWILDKLDAVDFSFNAG